jgi:hypothetical protein
VAGTRIERPPPSLSRACHPFRIPATHAWHSCAPLLRQAGVNAPPRKQALAPNWPALMATRMCGEASWAAPPTRAPLCTPWLAPQHARRCALLQSPGSTHATHNPPPTQHGARPSLLNVWNSRSEMEVVGWILRQGISQVPANELLKLLRTPGFNATTLQTSTVAPLLARLDAAFGGSPVRELDLHIPEDHDQKVVFYWRDPMECILELLRDPLLSGKLYLFYHPRFTADGQQRTGPANGSLWWQLHQIMNPQNPICAVITASDATKALNRLGIHPIILSLANIPEWIRGLPRFWKLVGIVPMIRFKDGKYPSKKWFKRRKRFLMAECAAQIESHIMKSDSWKGFQVETDGNSRCFVPHMFTKPGDDAEHADLQFRHGFNCPCCAQHTDNENSCLFLPRDQNFNEVSTLKAATSAAMATGIYGGQRWMQQYRAEIPTARPITIPDQPERSEDTHSGQAPPEVNQARYDHCSRFLGFNPDHNPLWDVPGTGTVLSTRNPDPLHMVEIGLMVHIIVAVILLLRFALGLPGRWEPQESPEGDEEASWNHVNAQGQHIENEQAANLNRTAKDAQLVWADLDRRMTAVGVGKFARAGVLHGCRNGLDNRGKISLGLTAAETLEVFLDLPLCLTGLWTLEGLGPLCKGKLQQAVCSSIKAIADTASWYWNALTPDRPTSQLAAVHSEGVALMNTLQKTFEKVKKFSFPKFHMILHVVSSCLLSFGSWQNCSAEVVELRHTILKCLCELTNRHTGWQKQVFERDVMLARYHDVAAEMERLHSEGPVQPRMVNKSDEGDDEEAASCESEFLDRLGCSIPFDSAAHKAFLNSVQRARSFPWFQAAVDFRGLKTSLQARMSAPAQRVTGSPKFVNFNLRDMLPSVVSSPEVRARINVVAGSHVLGEWWMHSLPRSMAQYFFAVSDNPAGMQVGNDPYDTSRWTEQRIAVILKSNMKRFANALSQPENCPIRVMGMLEFDHAELTGGQQAWGDLQLKTTGLIRCFPFANRSFWNLPRTPVVAVAPYRTLGPFRRDGSCIRPVRGGIHPEHMAKPDMESWVVFARVVLLFQARVVHNRQAVLRDFAFVQPLPRYTQASDLTPHGPGASRYVRLYEPSVGNPALSHCTTSPFVVEVDRVLCEVPVVADMHTPKIPADIDITPMHGACKGAQGSRLFYVDTFRLMWARSKIHDFNPGSAMQGVFGCAASQGPAAEAPALPADHHHGDGGLGR